MRPPLVINGIDFNQRLDDAAILIDLSIDLIFSRDEYVREQMYFFDHTGMLIRRNELLWENIKRMIYKDKGIDPVTGYRVFEN